MLTEQENETLTHVGAGTPIGELLRRYWQPIATAAEIQERWTKRVRIFGEDLVLYRDRSGALGLIAEACPHRRASLAYGIPDPDGIRCPYHGWKFDATGACVDQPNEPEGSTFKDKISTPAYPLGERGGLLFAYLGPAPAPAIPRFEAYLEPRAIRTLGRALVPANWLPIVEHAGGAPVIFPNIRAVRSAEERPRRFAIQFSVPVDDTHTLRYWYDVYAPAPETDVPARLLDRVFAYDVPLDDAAAPDGGERDATVGETLQRELANVAAGRDPIGTLREGDAAETIAVPLERGEPLVRASHARHAPIVDELIALFGAAAAGAR